MQINKSTLSNGLTLVTASVPGVESCTVQVFVRAGSRDEDARVGGLAHFLEHMVFKGTSRYPSAHAISSAADSVGAEINASTDKERTAFYLKVTQKHIDLAFEVLSDMAFVPLLEQKEIEREKGVIIQEIAMYEDLPQHKAESAFEELLYGESEPLGRDIAGKAQNVKRITRNDFVKFRENFYRPENMVLSVAGKFDQAQVEELANKYFGGGGNLQGPAGGSSRSTSSKDVSAGAQRDSLRPRHPSCPAVKLVNKKTEQAHLVIGFRGNPLGHKDRYVETVLASILGGGMSSRLFTEVREKRGLAYYVRSDIEHYTDAGYLGARAGVELGKVEEAVRVILGEFSKLVTSHESPVTKKELDKAREFSKGRFLLQLEDTETVSDFFGEGQLLEGKTRTVEQVIDGINSVTLEDIYRVAKEFFVPERLNLAIVGPYEDSLRFQKLFRVL